jgi:hypothetical protein
VSNVIVRRGFVAACDAGALLRATAPAAPTRRKPGWMMSESGTPDLPARQASSRQLTTQELEAVIRRAVELQSGPASREEGVSEIEAVRIGQELGLDAPSVRRAIAEVRSRPPAEQGALGRSMGSGVARAARVLRRPAAQTGMMLEEYLCDCEFMLVQRRLPDRTRYVKDASFAAGLARMGRGFTRRHQSLDLQQIDVAVAALDADSCLVEVSVQLGSMRAGLAAGALGGGGGAAIGLATAIWATPVADPLMLLGVPVLGAFWYGMRAIYRRVHGSTQEKLESLLDRLEHNELPLRQRRR